MAVITPDIDIEEMITGEKFEEMCDIDAEKDIDFEYKIKNSHKDILTFFTQTHELKNRIPILRKINKKFIVVAHNSDGHIQYEKAERSFDYQWKNEKNVIHWFCQNVDVDESNVTPIPIALENTYIFQPEVKQGYMVKLRERNIKKDFKVFICYNPDTNPGERKPPIRMFGNSPWVNHIEGYNNVDLAQKYFDNMVRCQFVLCPDGNGMDTIRLWEALYLGCIPIVKPHVFTRYFAKHLPIVIVDDWKDINVRFLIKKFQEVNGKEYNWDVLRMSYWKKVIEEKRRK